MKKIDCIFYLVDNSIFLYNLKSKNITRYNLRNYICNGRIVKVSSFIKKINEIIKQERIIKIFTGQNAIIIYEPFLKYNDKKIILDSFEQCGFKDIKLISTLQILPKNKNYIEINENYLILYSKKKYTVININEYFKVKDILKRIISKITEEIFLLGINDKIPEFANLNKNLFYLEDSIHYFLYNVKKN